VHIYTLGPKLLQWNFLRISQLSEKWCAETFPPIFEVFAIFDCNFAKIVAPPSNENENYVMHLKEQSILKKVLEIASKSTNKPSHDTCLNYAPPRAGRPSVT